MDLNTGPSPTEPAKGLGRQRQKRGLSGPCPSIIFSLPILPFRLLEDAGASLLPCPLLSPGRLCHSQAWSLTPAGQHTVLGSLWGPGLAEGRVSPGTQGNHKLMMACLYAGLFCCLPLYTGFHSFSTWPLYETRQLSQLSGASSLERAGMGQGQGQRKRKRKPEISPLLIP